MNLMKFFFILIFIQLLSCRSGGSSGGGKSYFSGFDGYYETSSNNNYILCYNNATLDYVEEASIISNGKIEMNINSGLVTKTFYEDGLNCSITLKYGIFYENGYIVEKNKVVSSITNGSNCEIELRYDDLVGKDSESLNYYEGQVLEGGKFLAQIEDGFLITRSKEIDQGNYCLKVIEKK